MNTRLFVSRVSLKFLYCIHDGSYLVGKSRAPHSHHLGIKFASQLSFFLFLLIFFFCCLCYLSKLTNILTLFLHNGWRKIQKTAARWRQDVQPTNPGCSHKSSRNSKSSWSLINQPCLIAQVLQDVSHYTFLCVSTSP